MPYNSEHKTRRTLIIRECEWGERKHRKSEYKILENNYGRDCRKEIKTGTNGEGEKERNKRDKRRYTDCRRWRNIKQNARHK